MSEKIEEMAFETLLTNKSPFASDFIEDQLREFIKFKNPQKKFTNEEIVSEINNHLGTTKIHNYGVWVYYSWSNRLVHILDEDEFV